MRTVTSSVFWLWLGFAAVVGMTLRLHRKVTPNRRAAWFVSGLAFVALVYPMYQHAWFGATLAEPSDKPGADAAIMFVSAYLLE